MITVTPRGRNVIIKAITDQLKHVHLFTDDGEVTGYEYQPIRLDSNKWKDGVYPDIVFQFGGGEAKQLRGWYMTNEDGFVVLNESFDITKEDEELGRYRLGRVGAKVIISPILNLITGG